MNQPSPLKAHLTALLPDLCDIIPPLAAIIAEYAADYQFGRHSEAIELSNYKQTATAITQRSAIVAVSAQPLPRSGRHRVLFKIERLSSYMTVGLVPESYDKECNTYIGNEDGSWGFSNDSYIYSANFSAKYGQGYSAGNLVGIDVDFEEDTISFNVNGKDEGVAFRNLNLKKHGPLFPAVSLRWAGNSATFASVTSIIRK